MENWYTRFQHAYIDTVWAEMEARKTSRILEIGGTTHRSTGTDDLPDYVQSYTIGDISPSELANVPKDRFDVAEFDACGDVSHIEGGFDLIVSKFCGEHMKDGHKFHANMRSLLAPGGSAVHLVPTLFASPFVLNTIIPEALSRSLVRIIQPQRFNNSMGKFPAYYSLCRSSRSYLKKHLLPLGYSDVEVQSFYGHHYYDRIPGLKQLERGLCRLCAKRDWSVYASYAVIVARN